VATEQRLDIGGNHVLVLVTPDGSSEPSGADVEHLRPDGKPCIGWVAFDVAAHEFLPAERKWQVESWEPLTLSPSLLCGCGDHGFVRSGRWAAA
jgi:hypothetical protein